MRRPNLIHSIQRHEGTVKEDGRHKPYDDSDEELNDVIGKRGDIEGHCTIGYGRNLTVSGISEQEAARLLKNDIATLEQTLQQEFTFWPKLNQPRQNVLIELAYHLGYGDLLTFENMIAALQDSEYEKAATEILVSQYGENFPERSKNLADRMSEGVPYPNDV